MRSRASAPHRPCAPPIVRCRTRSWPASSPTRAPPWGPVDGWSSSRRRTPSTASSPTSEPCTPATSPCWPPVTGSTTSTGWSRATTPTSWPAGARTAGGPSTPQRGARPRPAPGARRSAADLRVVRLPQARTALARQPRQQRHGHREALGIRPTDRALTSLPLHYCYGLSVVHSHLATGAELVLTDLSVVDPCFWELVDAVGCDDAARRPAHLRAARPQRLRRAVAPHAAHDHPGRRAARRRETRAAVCRARPGDAGSTFRDVRADRGHGADGRAAARPARQPPR